MFYLVNYILHLLPTILCFKTEIKHLLRDRVSSGKYVVMIFCEVPSIRRSTISFISSSMTTVFSVTQMLINFKASNSS